MNNLYAFLNPQKIDNDFVYLDRFKDENGEIVPIEIKALTQKENAKIMRNNTRKAKNGEETLDRNGYSVDLILASIVNIDFQNAELQKAYNVLGEKDLISTMFTVGEFATLTERVTTLCGFDRDINEDIETAKN